MIEETLTVDPFDRSHVGKHGAFVLRTNRDHVDIVRKAVAYRLGVPVGSIRIDWNAVRDGHEVIALPVKRRAA